jgi:hypothetical protein
LIIKGDQDFIEELKNFEGYGLMTIEPIRKDSNDKQVFLAKKYLSALIREERNLNGERINEEKALSYVCSRCSLDCKLQELENLKSEEISILIKTAEILLLEIYNTEL